MKTQTRQHKPMAFAITSLLIVLAMLVTPMSAFAAQEMYNHWGNISNAWEQGSLGQNNSMYAEGWVVPHYWRSQKLTVGNTYGFNIYYDYFYQTKNTCGFDYLTQFNQSVSPTWVAGTAYPDVPTGGDTFPDPQAYGDFYVLGADILSVSQPVEFGDGIRRYVQVKFKATDTTSQFYWGFHLALDNAIGNCAGADNWSGASLQTDVSDTPVIPGATMLGGGGTMTLMLGGVVPTEISGYKWFDTNSDGVWGPEEEVLPGWTIQLCSDAACSTVLNTAVTDVTGFYAFPTGPGTYYVREVQQAGFAQTYPVGNVHGPLVVTNTTTSYGNQNFGNTKVDLYVQKACPDLVNGTPDPIIFTVQVENKEAGAAKNIVVSDSLMTGFTYSDFTSNLTGAACGAVGQDVTCTLPALAGGATWYLGIEVTMDLGWGVPVDNLASASNDIAEVGAWTNNGTCSTTTPITLSSFQALREGDVTRFTWSTATEINNVGFNLFVKTDGGMQQINDEIIKSQKINSQNLQVYTYEATGLAGESFSIQDVDIYGIKRMRGSYQLGESYGRMTQARPIDWNSVRADSQQKTGNRLSGGADLKAVKGVPTADIKIKQDGVYRITYEQLLAAGVNFSGVQAANLALTSGGQAVPMRVISGLRFGPGSSIEFVGKGLDTLYTDTNIYTLKVDAAQAARIGADTRQALGQPPATYPETVKVDRNLAYTPMATNGDPWFDTMLLAWGGSPATWTFPINVQGYVPGGQANLSINLWGVSDMLQGPDHHTLIALNGAPLADLLYDGLEVQALDLALPAGVLLEGQNQVQISLPSDLGAEFDMSVLDRYSVTYPRAFVAREGRLVFSGTATAYKVSGLPSRDIVVYRQTGDTLARMSRVSITDNAGSFTIAFAGMNRFSTYYVVSTEGLRNAEIAPSRAYTDISSGQAAYLIISHPDFKNGLGGLVAAKEAQGLSVKVVDVQDVYAQYGAGVFGPDAIRAYVRYAAENLGTQYVLLVGGDSYDYRNYLGFASQSFIPSIYAQAGEQELFAPADPLYGDVNGDGLADLAVGRFPVRTSAELAAMVAKSQLYAQKDYIGTAVLAADNGFTADSQSFSGGLAGWNVQTAYLDELALGAARQALIDALNAGVALTSYVGHSGPVEWTFSGLFNSWDAIALTNFGRPTVVVQWGCWNTNYVDPEYNSMAHEFLLNGTQGAAAVLGATTVTSAISERALGQALMPLLSQPGMTLGAALQMAKAQIDPVHTDVLLGWTILGDPALVVQP